MFKLLEDDSLNFLDYYLCFFFLYSKGYCETFFCININLNLTNYKIFEDLMFYLKKQPKITKSRTLPDCQKKIIFEVMITKFLTAPIYFLSLKVGPFAPDNNSKLVSL